MIFNIRMASVLFLGLPLIAGASIGPQTAGAFVMGAWAGVLLAAPPAMILGLCLGLLTLRQVLAPLVRLPVLIGLSVLALYALGVDVGFGVHGAVAALMLWWALKGRRLLRLYSF